MLTKEALLTDRQYYESYRGPGTVRFFRFNEAFFPGASLRSVALPEPGCV